MEDKDTERLKNMFSWVDNDTFRVVIDQGVEIEYNLLWQKARTGLFGNVLEKAKWVLEEVGFTTVPYFNQKDLSKYHFFEEPEPLHPDNTVGRLRRKYHEYKRATLIRHFDDTKDNPELAVW